MQIQPTVSMMLEIKVFFFNSNYKNVKNINQKKKVQFLKNKRFIHKTNLILCTFNIHMPIVIIPIQLQYTLRKQTVKCTPRIY